MNLDDKTDRTLFRAVVTGAKEVRDAVTGRPVDAGTPVVMVLPAMLVVSPAGLAELARAFDDPAAKLPATRH